MPKIDDVTLVVTYVPMPNEHIPVWKAGIALLLQLLVQDETQCHGEAETQPPSVEA